MIRVTMLTSGGRTCGFDCVGHADYAASGEDIVCSAVSALVQTAVLGIRSVADIPAGYSLDEGNVHCVIGSDATEHQCEQAALLLDTMAAGLCSIQEAYPKTLKISDREV